MITLVAVSKLEKGMLFGFEDGCVRHIIQVGYNAADHKTWIEYEFLNFLNLSYTIGLDTEQSIPVYGILKPLEKE